MNSPKETKVIQRNDKVWDKATIKDREQVCHKQDFVFFRDCCRQRNFCQNNDHLLDQSSS